ncbi:MAG TPA: HAMP domain-containing sensor histidine kinase [Gaiellaceae bacterium]
MNPLRTVGGRLALALLVVVTGALAIVYIVVVPSYQRSLVNTRLSDLNRTLTSIMQLSRRPDGSLDQAWAEDTAFPVANANGAGTRVVVFEVLSQHALAPIADAPRGASSADVENDSVAKLALSSRRPVRREISRGDDKFAESAVAVPSSNRVVLLSLPLHNDLRSVAVVQRRVIIAGAIATLFAILLGYALATLFARRIRRLERAAERIAGGDFDNPVEDGAPDELGQLARAFERMRLQLASLDRARRDFIANASHELRTPLFSLGGFLELLAGEDLDAETRAEFINETRAQVSRLQKLATDLLDLTRLDAGRLAVSNESFDLATVGEVLLTEFSARALAAGKTLKLNAPVPVFAMADEERVLQVGRGLVDNALVHTPAATTVEVVVTTDNDEAQLTVTDDGPGIPAEAQAHVFDRFFRLGGTVASGSGLGLAIARELAGLMGGRIELESRPARTRFTLVLPADVFGTQAAAGIRAQDEARATPRRIAQV